MSYRVPVTYLFFYSILRVISIRGAYLIDKVFTALKEVYCDEIETLRMKQRYLEDQLLRD